MSTPSDPPPFPAPTTPADPSTAELQLIAGGREVPGGNAVNWIAEGWALFVKAPGIWIATVAVLFGLSIFISLVPLVGNLAYNLLSPVFTGGLMLGCRSLAQGGELRIDHLFAAFKDKAGQLVIVGLLVLLAVGLLFALVAIVAIVTIGSALLHGTSLQDFMSELLSQRGLLNVAVLALLFLALVVPVYMAYWFAPALIVFHDLDALTAMKQSFQGCLRNMVPFLLYGLVTLLLLIAALIPFLLGLLILAPVTIASVYAAYKDIYLAQQAA